MNIHTIILDLTSPIKMAPELKQYHFKMIDDLTMEIEISKDMALNQLFEDLSKQNIVVNSMRNKTNRLEELFVRLIAENKKAT